MLVCRSLRRFPRGSFSPTPAASVTASAATARSGSSRRLHSSRSPAPAGASILNPAAASLRSRSRARSVPLPPLQAMQTRSFMKKRKERSSEGQVPTRKKRKPLSDDEKKAHYAKLALKRRARRRWDTMGKTPLPTALSTGTGKQDEHDFWRPVTRKLRKKWIDLKSVPINRDRYWKDHDDNADHYELDKEAPKHYKPQIIESDFNPWRYQPDFGGKVRKPKFQLQPMWVQRTIHKLYTDKPDDWTPQRLSSNFGIALKQVKRYIQNVDLEIAMQKDGHKIDESLQEYIQEVYQVPDHSMVESRVFLTDVYNDRSRQFGYQYRNRLFGSTEDDILQRDLGVKKPRLRLRKEPKHGVGSGKEVATARTATRSSNLAIIDITKIGKYMRSDIRIPATIREKTGALRYPNIPELSWIRRKEVPTRARGKFSPH